MKSTPSMKKSARILITGNEGMVGKSLIKKLSSLGYKNLLLPKLKQLDLRNQKHVEEYFRNNKIDYVFHLAARVGGIAANIEFPAEFLYDNVMIATNVIEISRKYKVKKLLFLGSSCIYPRQCNQPMKEEYLLDGKLEPTNEGYALAKIVGLKLCSYYNKQYGTNFISLMPCNLYGVNDHFGNKGSHVISALISKFHNAKISKKPFVDIWGSGKPKREFLFVDDISEAMVYFINNYNFKDIGSFINVGYGDDISIKDLAILIKNVVGYQGGIKFNTKKPDGMPRKLLDVSKSKRLGWKAKINLKEGLQLTYEWFKENE
jgi:GDP-L-fucose synthase